MKEYLIAACFAAWIYLVYRFLSARLVRFAKKELRHSGISWKTADAIHMEAMAQSMEYYARMAILASESERIPVVIHIRKNDKDRAELLWMAEKLSAKHRNLTVQWI